MSPRHGFGRILVANRGEIAARVIRTCRRLGIETVLTVSDADAGSRPARLADKTIRIGPAPALASYLDADAVAAAAVAAGADAVHPGYGFLSENPRLARACAAAGVVFIGPAPETLEATGDKLAARELAIAAGLPVLPGAEAEPAGAAPFVEVGDEVREDTVVAIVETMKLMNSVPAGTRGRVAEICLGNAEPAAQGATLMLIEPPA